MEMTITRVRIGSVAKLCASLGALVGICIGVALALLGLFGISYSEMETVSSASPLLMGIVGLILLPILYGVGCALIGLLLAGGFNLAARYSGGVEVSFLSKDSHEAHLE